MFPEEYRKSSGDQPAGQSWCHRAVATNTALAEAAGDVEAANRRARAITGPDDSTGRAISRSSEVRADSVRAPPPSLQSPTLDTRCVRRPRHEAHAVGWLRESLAGQPIYAPRRIFPTNSANAAMYCRRNFRVSSFFNLPFSSNSSPALEM